MKRVLVCGFFVLACFASTATAQPAPMAGDGLDQTLTGLAPSEAAALKRFQAQFPDVLFYRENTLLTRVYGGVFGMGDTPQQAAEQFLAENAGLFGAEAADLLPITPMLENGNALPLMYDPEQGTYKFTLLSYSHYRDGLPVFRSGVRVLVENQPGYPVVWAGSSLKRLVAFRPDFAQMRAVDPTQVAPEMINFTLPEPVIWAGVNEQDAEPVLAWTFEADNDGSGLDPQRWLYVMDAATGAVVYRENRIIFTDVTGQVHGMATTIPKSDTCNPEVDTVMPWAKVIVGSTFVYTNTSGNFSIPSGGGSPQTVTSYLAGQYFTVDNFAGDEETLMLDVIPPGPANFMHNQANISEAIRAQVNAYVQANVIRDWVLTYHPTYPTISTQTDFPIYVNRTDGYCPGNAWYSPGSSGSMNFCSSSGSYPNTAYSNVVHHEYGHHMCEVAGTDQDQYGEGVGDSVAVCIADDPILGYGFTGSCSSGLRTADNTLQYPCSGEIHYCGQLISGCVWSTRNQLIVTHPGTYLGILSSLMINSIPMHAGSGTINPAIYADWITLDGGISGPHYAEITNGFAVHNMVPVPSNNDCANATAIGNGSFIGTTTPATNDGTASCGSSSSTQDVWFGYTAQGPGTLTVSTCTASFNTVLSVHTGCPGTSSNQIGCNNDSTTCGAGSTRSYLSVPATAGTTYYIRVSGNNGANGTFTLVVSGPADVTPPTPNPMTFETPPTPNGMSPTTAIDMVATMASDPSTPVQYAFNANTGPSYPGADSRGWGAGRTYTDQDLTPNTSYVYRTKARDNLLNEASPSADASATTHIETPTGVSFGAVTSNSIPLIATGTLTKLTIGSSGVWFDSLTAGGDGGINAWVQASTDTATGLSPDTSYTFQAMARNQNAVETPYSETASKWTLALVPTAPTLGSPTTTTMTLNVNPGGNPETTTFAIRCTAATPADATWTSQYVDALGNPSATAVWQTDATWGVITIQGLHSGRTYTFAVKARNGDGVETVFGPGASLPTQTLTGGACCNPTTGVCTTATQAACTGGGGVYQGDDTTCTPNPCAQPCALPGDINVDGWVDGLDIAGFVRAKLGQASLPGENPACADYGGDLNADLADFVAGLLG